jgi:hypothetical protein
MAGVSFPVKRPVGRALVVASASSRSQPLAAMQALGYTCAEIDDPYAAAAELFQRPLVYRCLILSLASLYREELSFIGTLKRRLPHVDVWLTHIDGRHAALAEALRLGADGLLGEDGALHRMGVPQPGDATGAGRPSSPSFSADIDEAADSGATSSPSQHVFHEGGADEADMPEGQPVLSAEELRALLQEQPTLPPDVEA